MALTINKTIRPNAIWQEMYLQVRKDQRVVITADGLWSPEMRPATIVWCGPDGIEGHIATDDYLLPGANVGALIARIGNNSAPIAVGNYHDFHATCGGPLFMAMNEHPEYHNQAGALKAQIILFDL